jgi:uncharacterized iron-regulated protein
MGAVRYFSLARLLPLLGVACASRSAPKAQVPSAPVAQHVDDAAGGWLTTLDVSHPLVGRIWDTAARGFVSSTNVLARAARGRFVLLGEKHDNPDHHRLQALVLKGLVDTGERPRVAFEMLEVDRQAAVDGYRKTAGASASGFGAALGWDASGWPPFREYQPIFEVAFSARLDIVAANLEHELARGLVHAGLAALPPERAALLDLERPFPPALDGALREELGADHCGMLPDNLLEPMALAQHARDAQMARALLDGGETKPGVLVAGGGHVRRDRGVPYYLALHGANSVVTIDFEEVTANENDAARYVRVSPDGAAAVDFVWFTPRASDGDPCAAFTRPKTAKAPERVRERREPG